MDSDDSTVPQPPRLEDAFPVIAPGHPVVNSPRSLSPHAVELPDTVAGTGTPPGNGPSSKHDSTGPRESAADKVELPLTPNDAGSVEARSGPETLLDQPRLFYAYPSYPNPPGWSGRSAYHALVKDKTHVQITTTASYIMRVLGLRVSLSQPDHSAHPRYDDVVVTASELRAIYMKALVWFVERECLDEGSCQVVFVGGVNTNSPDAAPAVPLDDLRDMADQLPEDYRDADSIDDFDAFMFHAGAFFVERRGWLSGLLVGLFVIIAVLIFALILPSLLTRAQGERMCLL